MESSKLPYRVLGGILEEKQIVEGHITVLQSIQHILEKTDYSLFIRRVLHVLQFHRYLNIIIYYDILFVSR